MVNTMAKNKKKTKYKYTKQEFIDICCSKCNICTDIVEPELCYSELYARHPKKFIKIVFKKLLRVSETLNNSNNYNGKDKIDFIVKKAFCDSHLCGHNTNDNNDCALFSECTTLFEQQVIGEGDDSSPRRKKRKKKKRYIVQPYPSFFTNSRQGFLDEIGDILQAGTCGNYN